MAVLKLYNDEKVIELLNDEADVNRPYDSWNFDGDCGLQTERSLFLLIEEGSKRFWRSIDIRYNMSNSKFYINNLCHEDGFEIELNFDDEIYKYFMIDTENITNFEEMIKDNN